MAELIEKIALIEKLEDHIEYDAFDHYKEDALINMSFEKLEDVIASQPTTSEAEIRAKAIDEFAERIKTTLPIAVHMDCSEIDYEVDCALYSMRNRIDRIAEQMKESE